MAEPVVPAVSVLMPVYNGERFLAEAIDSVLGQTRSSFELLLIDDGSSDGSRDILGSYADPRIRVSLNEKNMGIARTLNRGLDLARGRYVAVLDDDDRALPGRLERQLAFLERNEDYAAIGTWAVSIDAAGRELGTIKRLRVEPAEVQSQLLFRCCLLHPSIMARTEILRRHRYREDFLTCSDYDLWIRVSRSHRLGSLPVVLTAHREHPDRATHLNSARSRQEKRAIIADQLGRLELDFDESDLERHFFLQRSGSAGFVPDHEYLEWANEWLLRLREANRRSSSYPERPFERVVARVWRTTCRAASKALGLSAFRVFARSPLGVAACATSARGLFVRPGV